MKETVDAIAVNTEGIPYFDPSHRMPEPEEVSVYWSSLVVVVSTESGDMLQLAHFSVKEFSTSNRIEGVFAPELQKVTASASIAKVCIAYLLQFDHELRLDEVMMKYPLARYCAISWMNYATVVVEDEDSLMGLIERFFCITGVP
jgi:hypothetical protein